MLRYEIKALLVSQLKTICDNVETIFSHPQSRAEEQGEFPYLTCVWRQWTPADVNMYGKQTVDIIGIVTGDDNDLGQKIDSLEKKVIEVLYKNEKIKNNILLINNSNLFEPFGLNAGVYPPFAGFRIEIEIGNVRLT